MAGILYLKKFSETGDREIYEKGAKILEQAHRHNPYDVYVMIHRIDLEAAALKKNVIQKPSGNIENLVSTMIKMDKNNPTVYESAIKFKIEEKKYKDVVQLLEKAKALRPEEIKYYVLEGNMHRAAGDDAKAIESFKKGISIAENNGAYNEDWASAKHNIAIHYFNKKDFNGALKEVNEITEKMPNNVHAHNMKGDIYGVMGNFDKARDSFKAALKIDPGNQNAKRGLEQIKQIMGK
jgi:tetratricopeptide (TPR) repeat protein